MELRRMVLTLSGTRNAEYLCYNMWILLMNTLCNKPSCLTQKARSRFPVSWGPGILCRRSLCASFWSSAASRWRIMTWLGRVLKWCLRMLKGKWPNGFCLKNMYPRNVDEFCWFSISFLSPTQIMPNKVSFLLCLGSGRCTKSKLLPILLDGESSKMRFS